MTEETKEEYQVCYKHPERRTYLRCNRCGRPICQDCAVLTPTGYRCKDCIKEQQKVFDTSEPKDHIIGGLIALAAGYIGSAIEARISSGLMFSFLTALILGGLAGKLICFLVRKAAGGRRSRLLTVIVTAAAGIGAALPRLYPVYLYGSMALYGGAGTFLAWLPTIAQMLLFPIVLCISVRLNMEGIVLNR